MLYFLLYKTSMIEKSYLLYLSNNKETHKYIQFLCITMNQILCKLYLLIMDTTYIIDCICKNKK